MGSFFLGIWLLTKRSPQYTVAVYVLTLLFGVVFCYGPLRPGPVFCHLGCFLHVSLKCKETDV